MSEEVTISKKDINQNVLQWQWGFTLFENGSYCNGICKGLAQFYKTTFSVPFGIFYVKTEIRKQFF